jgi:parallel beta-helix repeat protein
VGTDSCVIDNNTLKDNVFFGIVIVNGEHTISKAKILGGSTGVAAIATNSDTIATLDKVKIDDSTIPVEELSTYGFTAEVISLQN